MAYRLTLAPWLKGYRPGDAAADGLAALIVTLMLIPQSLAYALVAGVPAQMGLYASILPLLAYALFGSSRTLAVGPVAVVSLMTAAAAGQVAGGDSGAYLAATVILALLSGVFLVAMGLLRLGWIANLLSHSVISGFITASGLLIAASQLKHLLGIPMQGDTLWELGLSASREAAGVNGATLLLGAAALLFLLWARGPLKRLLARTPLPPMLADLLAKAGPVLAVVATTVAAWQWGLGDKGVAIVGEVPQSLPPFTMPGLSYDLIQQLAMPAILISIIGFVESVSVAQTLAAKKRQRINPDQELIGLGAANIGAAFTGGYPVTGGFARSVVNFDAGAETPAAGAYTAVGLAIAAVALTPLVYFLPKATLAATIIVAVLSLVDFSILKKTWVYSKSDFAAVVATILLTLCLGVEIGVSAGVLLSIMLHLYKTSRPHVAEVGLVPGTQHFRNIKRHRVETDPRLLMLRVDESLYFVNARFLEDIIQNRTAEGCEVEHVILMCSAVNEIDFSALESLEAINERLKDLDVGLHLSEVKGPVMDKLQTSHLICHLNGKVFLSQYDAWKALCPKAFDLAAE